MSLDCDDLDFPNQHEMPRLRPGPDRAWVTGAACGDKPGHWWFPEGDSTPPEAAEALAVCTTCPVRVACLNHALDHHEEGIWGGTTERDRRSIRRRRRSGAA